MSSFTEYRFHFTHLELLPTIVSPSPKVARVDLADVRGKNGRRTGLHGRASAARAAPGPPAGPRPPPAPTANVDLIVASKSLFTKTVHILLQYRV